MAAVTDPGHGRRDTLEGGGRGVSWTRSQEVAVTAGAALMLAASGVLLVARRPAPPIRVIEAPRSAALVVQVDGAVARPGVYRLAPGSRVADALAAAGGPLPDGDLAAVNRAHPVRDGERISLPPRRPEEGAGARPLGAAEHGRLLDLNTATAAELEALPGIGPVLAQRIVEHRTRRGAFRRLDDLLQVKGVGPRLLEGLRARVVIR
jgi:competence protein ComEA